MRRGRTAAGRHGSPPHPRSPACARRRASHPARSTSGTGSLAPPHVFTLVFLPRRSLSSHPGTSGAGSFGRTGRVRTLRSATSPLAQHGRHRSVWIPCHPHVLKHGRHVLGNLPVQHGDVNRVSVGLNPQIAPQRILIGDVHHHSPLDLLVRQPHHVQQFVLRRG